MFVSENGVACRPCSGKRRHAWLAMVRRVVTETGQTDSEPIPKGVYVPGTGGRSTKGTRFILASKVSRMEFSRAWVNGPSF